MKNIIKFLSIAFITILSVFAFNATVAHAEDNECDICHEYANEFVMNEQDIYSRSFERNHATIVDYEAALEIVDNEYNFYYNAYNHIEKDHTTAITEEEATTTITTTIIISDEPETTSEELIITPDEPEETTSEVVIDEPTTTTTTARIQTNPTTTTKKASTTTAVTTKKTTPTNKTTTSTITKATDNTTSISHSDIEFHGINCSVCYELANQFVSNEQDIYSRSFERNHATIVDYEAALELVNNEFEYYYAINNHYRKE